MAKWVVSGKADLISPDGVLDDYKFTSVWSVAYAKLEWEQQLNLYNLLYGLHGLKAKAARIIAVLRDWSKAKAVRESDYPQVGVVVRDIPLWNTYDQINFTLERVKLHQDAEKLADDDLPECTPEERWAKDPTWAVIKKGNKRAKRVFKTEHEADGLIMELGAAYVREFRPGAQTVRCESYCAVKDFCNQYKRIANGL
jgi:hypothetical protein